MSRVEYFTVREASDEHPYKDIIVPNYANIPFNVQTGGSYAVAPARVLGLDYVTYLRFVRDSFPGIVTIEGKGHKYPTVYWTRASKEMLAFVKLLNNKMAIAIQEASAK